MTMLRLNDRLYEEAKDPEQGSLPLDPAPAEDVTKKLEARLAVAETASQQAAERAARLEQMLAAGRQQAPAPVQDPQALRQQMNDAVWNNPVDSIDQMIRIRLGQQAAQFEAASFENNKATAIREGRDTDPVVWKMYEPEVAQYMKDNYPPQAQTIASVWKHATEVIRGRHAEEVAEAKRKSRENDGPGAPSNKSMPRNPTGDDADLDPEEKFVASEVFNISEKQYKEGKKFHEAQRKGADVNGRAMLKSAWAKQTYIDPHRTVDGWPNPHYGKRRPMITFDSDLQRPRSPQNG